MKPSDSLSRRDWLRMLFPSRTSSASAAEKPGAVEKPGPQVAVIMGRNCLAYQRSFCSVCVERCPVAGAITSTRGIPRVEPELCNGCGICVELCPAYEKAIRLFPKRPSDLGADFARESPEKSGNAAGDSQPSHLARFLEQQQAM